MNESAKQLFDDLNNQKNEIDNAFDMAFEELASELEITVDYLLMEFF